MCGRTSSARPPVVWVRQTGARRYISARRQGVVPSSNASNGNTNNQSNNQSDNQPNSRSSNQANQTTKSAATTSTPTKSTPTKPNQTVIINDTYHPSFNVGPHFYLPVLRYLNMKPHSTSNKRTHHQFSNTDTLPVESPAKKIDMLIVESPAKRARFNNSITPNLSPKQREIAGIESLIADNIGVLDTSELDAKLSPRKVVVSPSRFTPSPSRFTPSPSSIASYPSSTRSSTPSVEPELVVEAMRWGLIPSWTKGNNIKEADSAQPYNMINARAETLPDTKAYRHLLSNNRCVVLVDLYYEWAQLPDKKKTKQPYVFQTTKLPRPIASFDDDIKQTVDDDVKSMMRHVPDIYALGDQDDTSKSFNQSNRQPVNQTDNQSKVEIKNESNTSSPTSQNDQSIDQSFDQSLLLKPFLLLAGLFDTWQDSSTGEDTHTITILTQSASQSLAWAHERQPVMLTDEQAHQWLRCDLYSYEQCRPFTLKPSSENIEFYACPPIVGNVRNQSAECVMRLEDYEKQKKSNGIARFFQPIKNES